METKRLSGKTAVVTAGASGIGRASAESFARAGARVLAVDIDAKAVQAVPGCEGFAIDVRDATAIADFARGVGKVDVLFNCAGTVPKGTVLDIDPATWNAAFDLNVTSMYHMIRAFLPGMLARQKGTIVNVASIASSIIGVPNRFIYGVTKAALLGLTKSVAVEYVKQGIRCNAICPGTVETPSLGERIKALGNEEEARKAFIARQPMGRLGTAAEIAALALYLASDESAFVTGQEFVIDGGWTAA